MNGDLLQRFRDEGFDPNRLLADPLDLFLQWMQTAVESGCAQPEAMALATVDAEGEPGVRNVLVRGIDARGLAFYTNERSVKGRSLFNDHRCEALFSWLELDRQVRVHGRAGPVSPAESDAYFAQRPRLSQIGAHASRQSEPLASREELERKVAELEARYDGTAVPRPQHWGGFRLAPVTWEFWQGRTGRLHDRYRYSKRSDGTWTASRLNP